MTNPAPSTPRSVAIIGGGPAGLMAAEVLSQAGIKVDVYDAMPSVGRIAPLLRDFDAHALRAWIHGLGIDTFVGSSGRVFPTDMKAAPLLRAWLKRLREAGITIHTRHRWLGWDEAGNLRIANAEGEQTLNPDALLLALGGASWSRLGSDGAWWPLLAFASGQLRLRCCRLERTDAHQIRRCAAEEHRHHAVGTSPSAGRMRSYPVRRRRQLDLRVIGEDS
jgi:predicted flavoprotein YhiN